MQLDAKMRSLREMLLVSPAERSVRTDSSIFVVYPPDVEIEFRNELQKVLHVLEQRGVALRHIDLTMLPFEVLEARGLLPDAFAREFEDYGSLKRGLARAVHDGLKDRVTRAAAEIPGGVVILSGTSALYPVIKFGDVLKELQQLPCRIVLAFPGHDEGGKLHFMNQRDGYNYLAVKL
jgi:hypothetical protein